MCYRDEDVQPPSCCGGTRLSKRQSRNAPGIYFEGEHGKWNHCACDDEYRDAAFLMYTYRPLMKQVELACGGFSGEATAALAAGLNRIVTGIKPQYIPPTLRIGMYIVEFKFQNTKRDREELNGNGEFDIKLLPVGTSALERRLSPTETLSPQRRPSEAKSVATGTIGRPRSACPK